MEWISINDNLPDKNVSVLIYSKYDGISMGYRVTDIAPFLGSQNEREWMKFGYDAELTSDVSHWMPLPNPPQNK